ncbi:MAG: 2-C-methyl-D-erythritol 4-phosphate cytidylyltransferase [Bacteroidales bacterium]|nr:2-C-methyl-D-erythritol 4-phosphate cytidylyltransferase [Bacteroidales bacterium]
MVYVIIVAAGRGSRFGADLPKQFCLLGDYPVLMHTAIRMGRCLPQAQMAIVLSEDYVQYWEKLCEQHGFVSPRVVIGGDTRWQSVKNAIEALSPADDDYVLIHDGVRPVVTTPMIRSIMDGLMTSAAVIPTIPVTDSLRHIEADGRSQAVDRSTLVAVQTPQAFRAEEIKRAYSLPYLPEFTDDASVYEAAGYGSPALVEGSPLNIKITHPRDIEVAALFMGIK